MNETYLTVAEVAELLKLNKQTIRNWIGRGDLQAVRVGTRRVRVRRSDLDAFIARNPMSPARDPSSAEDQLLVKRADEASRTAWEEFRAAMASATTTIEDAHTQGLPTALDSLAAAACELSEVLRSGH